MAKPKAITDEHEKALYEKAWGPPEVPESSPSYIEVQKHLTQSGQEIANEGEMETIQIRRFEVEPAEVSLELGTVVKTGDYQTARVTVGCRMPCYAEEMVEAFEEVQNFVKERLAKERDEIVEWAKSKGIKNKELF